MIKLPWKIVGTILALLVILGFTLDWPSEICWFMQGLVLAIIFLPAFHEPKKPNPES